ncbi:molybdopterin-dependent oxidoreductase [Alkalimarinus alittae]|uniref:Molybdopterin-dependent oxidoreductase n=1 Tax=Alkalimarinus alittae TaxID=2961619 RepID=A0ABY6N3R8_9ALTE|nr:molybdopterin-dependent oxidoreductase [Alkalimarinus alittae]UZE96632.1 molybdopterin-dependent oxidoreductase [Alkalimarinus alittae]
MAELQKTNANNENWTSTACMLCSIGCGIEVQVAGQHLTKIRGDKKSAASEGYICQKAARLDHYQNHSERLVKPLRRGADGNLEEVEWDVAIKEIAEKMVAIREAHGGHSFAYYGGGGQGNHLGGAYSSALNAALGTPYIYTALAQEKTGDFWINGKLFGRQNCFAVEGMEHADYSIVLGANPWDAHGVPKTRDLLKAYKKDPNRTMVVIDPRLTESAKMADIHLAVKPGTDAFLLSAIIAIILQEGLEDQAFIAEHTNGFERIKAQFLKVPVEKYVEVAGLDLATVRDVAVGFASAKTATVRADLGIQQSLHSTLNSYLEKLLFLITGNFNKQGGNHLIALFAPIIGHSKEPEEGGPVTRVTGMKGISKLFPPNILPQEINTDHPERLRALVVDSANPVLSGADTGAYREAFKNLELSVVIDVALTETARLADYVLPASSQFEKTECTFFTFGFPTAYFHLRKPVVEPLGDTLPEPEIYRRLLVAMGAIPDRFPKLERIAKLDRKFPAGRLYPLALAAAFKANPSWVQYAPVILYATLGKALPENMASAASLWGVCQFYAAKYSRQVANAGTPGKGYAQGNALFNRTLASDLPVALATFAYSDTWKLMKTRDKKVALHIEEMFSALDDLAEEATLASSIEGENEYPFILMAGERRSYNANQIFRTPDWRKTDKEGAMRIHSDDLSKLGLQDKDKALCRSETGQIDVLLMQDDTVQPGMVTLPHGYGMLYSNDKGELLQNGPAINELTSAGHCDPIAKTPYHKHVAVAIERVLV